MSETPSRAALPPMGEQEKVLHAYIRQAEELARDIRIVSNGELSLAVVRNHGTTPKEREGLGWHAAHEAAVRIHRGEARPPKGQSQS